MPKSIHYAGEIRTPTLIMYAGYAACCSGERAYKIQADGQHTKRREDVTCRSCLKALARHDAHTPTRQARIICGSVPSLFLGSGKYPVRHTLVRTQNGYHLTACGTMTTGGEILHSNCGDPRLGYWNICRECVAAVASGTWVPRPIGDNEAELREGAAKPASGGAVTT